MRKERLFGAQLWIEKVTTEFTALFQIHTEKVFISAGDLTEGEKEHGTFF